MDVQAADADGRTAIMYAAIAGQHASVEALAGLGADVHLRYIEYIDTGR